MAHSAGTLSVSEVNHCQTEGLMHSLFFDFLLHALQLRQVCRKKYHTNTTMQLCAHMVQIGPEWQCFLYCDADLQRAMKLWNIFFLLFTKAQGATRGCQQEKIYYEFCS